LVLGISIYNHRKINYIKDKKGSPKQALRIWDSFRVWVLQIFFEPVFFYICFYPNEIDKLGLEAHEFIFSTNLI